MPIIVPIDQIYWEIYQTVVYSNISNISVTTHSSTLYYHDYEYNRQKITHMLIVLVTDWATEFFLFTFFLFLFVHLFVARILIRSSRFFGRSPAQSFCWVRCRFHFFPFSTITLIDLSIFNVNIEKTNNKVFKQNAVDVA